MARGGDRGPWQAYLERYVLEPATHADYLERVGIKRLLTLHELKDFFDRIVK